MELANNFDETRFEVSQFSSWNGPILATMLDAATTRVLWGDIRAIHAMASYNDIMEVY